MDLNNKYDDILIRISNGNETAFKELFDKYYDNIFNVAYYFLKSKECAKDVVADVFYTVWIKRHNLPNIKNIDSYLYIMTKNQALHSIDKIQSITDSDVSLYQLEYISETDNPEEKLMNDEYLFLVQKAIDSLPEKCKEVFRLYLNDRMKQKDIAQLLDISVKTVEMHISSAFKRISKYLNEEYKTGSDRSKRLFFLFF